MARRNSLLVLVPIAALVGVSCGSDSGGIDPAASVPGDVGDVVDDAQDVLDDAEEVVDDAQQQLDDAGVDLDLDELEETIENFSTGEGGGVVTVDGVAYTFEATGVCISQGSDFVAAGLGQAPDGTPVWVDVSASNDFDFDDDGETDPTLDVTVDVGRTELFGEGADDQPAWSATKLESTAISTGEDIAYTLDGGRISGSGSIQDFNGVAVPFGESVPFTFEASCS